MKWNLWIVLSLVILWSGCAQPVQTLAYETGSKENSIVMTEGADTLIRSEGNTNLQQDNHREHPLGQSLLISNVPLWYQEPAFAVFLIFLVLILGMGLLYYKNAYHKKMLLIRNFGLQIKEKYELSQLNKEASATTFGQIEKYLEETQAYLNPELSIQDIANAIDIHQRYISQAINENLNQGFPFLVNSYRVEEVKRRLQNPEYKRYTLVAIAEACGLRSKSTFNRTFKKITGKTPSEYLAIHHPEFKE